MSVGNVASKSTMHSLRSAAPGPSPAVGCASPSIATDLHHGRNWGYCWTSATAPKTCRPTERRSHACSDPSLHEKPTPPRTPSRRRTDGGGGSSLRVAACAHQVLVVLDGPSVPKATGPPLWRTGPGDRPGSRAPEHIQEPTAGLDMDTPASTAVPNELPRRHI